MTEFLSVPFKKSSDIDLSKPLKNIISSHYNTSDSVEDYNDSVDTFNRLRSQAIWKMYEKNESALEILYNYYDELAALDEKFTGANVQIPFKWKDAFEKGSLFSGRTSLTISSLKYELVCILFNVAALQSAVASAQNFESDDGLKLAAKLFQQAAGIFQYLKLNVIQMLKQDPTPDLQPDATNALASLMVAQAQEVFILKAIRDEMKDAIIAKLCSQCEEFYTDAGKLIQKDHVRNLVGASLATMVSGKISIFRGLAEYFQALVCKSNQSIGESITRLQISQEFMKVGEQLCNKTVFPDYLLKVSRTLAEVNKDNEFIYHERIPDAKSLERVPKAGGLAKASPFDHNSRLGYKFQDLFHDLTPVSVHQALAMYDVRRTDLMNKEVNRLRESTQLMNSILASLNLPAALEDSSGVGLPPSLLEKSEEVISKGGIRIIKQMMDELPELVVRNQQILDEATKMLTEEKQSDDNLRQQFKEKWTRTPSDKLSEPIRCNAESYRKMLESAKSADSIIRNRFYQHEKAIQFLSDGKEAIENAIPDGSTGGSSRNSPHARELRQLIEEVEQIKAQRDSIELELKSAAADMKETFLKALVQDGAIKESELSEGHLEETYGPLQKRIEESIARQDIVMAKIQTANTEFCKEKNDSSASVARENFMKELAGGYDAFMELKKNLEDGTKFYNDLTQHLVAFQNKIADFCFARKTEKEDILRSLTQDLSTKTGPVPSGTPYTDSTTSSASSQQHTAQVPTAATGASVVDGYRSLPYPVVPHGMPMPYAPSAAAPYPTYPPPPMPMMYNPYATLPQAHGYPHQQYSPAQYPTQQYYTYPPPRQ